MKPLVSILIPAYNAESWISDTIESALAQTWEPKEIIVVDDGSSDRTVEIAEGFIDKGVLVERRPHHCASAVRNHAFSVSKGQYIQWLDADDLLAPDKIALQLEALNSGPQYTDRTLLSSAWGRFIYRPQKAAFTPTSLWYDLPPLECILRKMEQNVYMQTSAWLVSRSLTEAAGAWNTELTTDDDGEYFCRVLLSSDFVKFVPEAKVYYRSGFDSLSYIGPSERKVSSLFNSLRLCISRIRALHDSPRVRAAGLICLQECFIYAFPDHPAVVARAEQLAQELGGKLTQPRLSWKYAWIRHLFGWSLAKRAQASLPRIKLAMRRTLDRMLYRLQKPSA